MDSLNLKIGTFFVNIFILFLNNVFDSEIEEGKTVIKINLLYIKETKDNIVISPSTLPMICLPKL